MSNRRRNLLSLYRAEFLRSRVWFARRDRWFVEETGRGRELVCVGCGRAAAKQQLELHHLDYGGLILKQDRWIAREAHDDLIPLHPYCHDLLHRLIDRDPVLSRGRTRREATRLALKRLTPVLRNTEEAS